MLINHCRNFLFLSTLFFSQLSLALTGLVVGVHDGDTITVLSRENVEHRIRLAQIDAPELSQDWGKVSKKSLSDLVYMKTVKVDVQSADRYGRLVGKVYQGDADICSLQVKTGMAWVYVKYNKDKSLVDDEAKARSQNIGLWSMPNAIAPWDWRKKSSSGG